MHVFSVSPFMPAPVDTARFTLRVLREDIGGFPDFATPIHPIPAMMDTGKRIELLHEALDRAQATVATIETDSDELTRLYRKALTMRARYLVRSIRRKLDMCPSLARLDQLVAEDPNVVSRVRLPIDLIEQAVRYCAA